MFKSQLQEYAQKAGLPAPVYDIKRDGPSHEPQFKASVTIEGNTYESPMSFGNLKKAEHAAAEVALAALGKSETGPLHESGLCKNLLQEYAQKCKLPLPIYSTVKTEETQQSPSFISTVEVAGVHYDGGVCKTKKEAEIKAAKTALAAIYADSGASPFPAVEPVESVPDTTVTVEVTTPAEAKSGTKRKKLVYAGASPLPAVEPVESVPDTTVTVEVTTPPEAKSGTKRKKLFKGGKEVRKQKVEGKQPEKVEESGNGDLVQAGDAKQANGSSSVPSGGAEIGPNQELLGSKAANASTPGSSKVAACANGNELPASCPQA